MTHNWKNTGMAFGLVFIFIGSFIIANDLVTRNYPDNLVLMPLQFALPALLIAIGGYLLFLKKKRK